MVALHSDISAGRVLLRAGPRTMARVGSAALRPNGPRPTVHDGQGARWHAQIWIEFGRAK